MRAKPPWGTDMTWERRARWQDIQPGDVWSVRSNSFLSFLIRVFSHGKWNHSGLVLDRDFDGNLWNIEALSKIERTPLSDYRAEFERGGLAVFRVPAPFSCVGPALIKIREELGGAYGWLSTGSLAVILPLNRLLNDLGINRQIPTPFRAHLKCSELVLVYLLYVASEADKRRLDLPGLDWVWEVPDRESFTPADLVAECS